MAKEFAKAFYKSKAWRDCRDSYIAQRTLIDGGMCEACHKQLGYIVHHKITLTASNIGDVYTSLNHEHLGYECKDCHDAHEGHGVGADKIPVTVLFDDNGDVIDRVLPPV